jgi:hypothetical protein
LSLSLSFLVIFGALSCDFCGGVFLVTLFQELPLIVLYLVVFRVG